MAQRQKGYTIIEVMLFLAISGALFTMSVLGMNGQQDKLRFRQSMDDIEFRIRNTINNVDQGYSAKLSNSTNYSCNGGTLNATTTASCVFVGREINMCNPTMFVASRVAPYNNLDYSEANAVIATTYAVNQEDFTAPGGVELKTNIKPDCRIAALNRTVGSSNQKAPRYKAPAGTGDNWTLIDDTNPTVLCFRDVNGTDKYAQITITQSDISLEVGVAQCD